MNKYEQIRQKAYKANMELVTLGLVKFTFGNASAADRKNGIFAIKPSGIPYDELSPDNMVIVDFDSNIIEGEYNPSSDTKTHAVLYKRWLKIGGIVHTHSTYSTAWAQAQQDIPIFGTTHADHLISDIPCTDIMSDEMIKGNYEYETGIQIIKCFEDKGLIPDEVSMVLVAGHGPFSWGNDVERAVYNSAIMEEIAKIALLTKNIAPNVSKLKDTLKQKHYERKHGKDSYYGQV